MSASGPELIATPAGHGGPVTGIAWSPDGKWLASAGRDHAVFVWDVERQTVLQSFERPAEVLTVTWHPRDKLLAAAGKHPSIIVRRLRPNTAELEASWVAKHHTDNVRSVAGRTMELTSRRAPTMVLR